MGCRAEPMTAIVSRRSLMSRMPSVTIPAVTGTAIPRASAIATRPTRSWGTLRKSNRHLYALGPRRGPPSGEKLERGFGLLERRDHVDAGRLLAGLLVQLARQLEPRLRGARAGVEEPMLHLVRNDDSRYLVMGPNRKRV